MTLLSTVLALQGPAVALADEFDDEERNRVVRQLLRSGEIRGSVDYCGSPPLSTGIEVSIPGKSFLARTGPDQKFTLSYVPRGTYSLEFRRFGRVVHNEDMVRVRKGSITNLDNLLGGPISFCPDLDGDGFFPPEDCNDFNPSSFPGAPEICGDGRDNNCDGATDESCSACTDVDGDGFFAQVGCGIVDCNDNDPAINPDALESCGDGVDNDCDAQIDEPDAFNAQSFFFDGDADGFGTESDTVLACVPPASYVADSGDCNDFDPGSFPGATEICGDGVDNNCDGVVDESCSTCTDADSDGFFAEAGCGGTVDCDDFNPDSFPGATEICGDGVDNDCNGVVDESCSACTDADGDSFFAEAGCGGTVDCDDSDSTVFPGGQEFCGDGIDNNCNGETDEGCSACTDADSDGFFGQPGCGGTVDCDDFDSLVFPGAAEICGDGVDNNCDGATDLACSCPPGTIDCGDGFCVSGNFCP